MVEFVFNIPCPDFLLTGRCNLRCKYCFEKEHPNLDMDDERLSEYLSFNPLMSAFPFGGEPLLVIDKLIKAIKIIEESPIIPKVRKKKTLDRFRSVITNGTLIPHIWEKLKENNIKCQISVDGIKESNDINRVYPNGKGTHDDIMKGILCCVEHDIEWSVHGVVNKDTLPYLFETSLWFFEIYAKYKGVEYAVEHLRHNTFQIIFEEEWDDNDINILIDQFLKLADWIWNHEQLSNDQKKKLFDNFFFKHGSICGAGAGLLALDSELSIYPCHRVVFKEDHKKYQLGNVFKPTEFRNFKLYNALVKLAKRGRRIYSAATPIDNYKNPNNLMWFQWCPVTYLQECNNPYFQPVKYNIMFTELNRAIRILRLSYFGNAVPTEGADRIRNC